MRDALVRVNHLRPALADELAQAEQGPNVELMSQRNADKVDAVLATLRRERRVRSADHRDVMSARAQTGRGLEHLVHRAGVELVELEDLENAHWLPVTGCRFPAARS